MIDSWVSRATRLARYLSIEGGGLRERLATLRSRWGDRADAPEQRDALLRQRATRPAGAVVV